MCEMITESNNKKAKNRKAGKAKVSRIVKDYSNDPFVVKKANASQKFLEKNGFPDLQKR